MFAAVLLALIPPAAQPEKIQAPKPVVLREGFYSVSGEISGKPYESLSMVQKHSPGVYVLVWYAGESVHVGVGTLDGTTLTVGFGSAGGMRGVATYEVGDGKLSGEWVALPGDGKRQTETMEFLKPLKKEK